MSEEGRSIWFDLYYFEDKLTVRSQTGSIPHFLFSKAKRNVWIKILKNKQIVSLKAGHVWILGKLFTNAAGDNEYVGFNIKGGSFSLSNKKAWSGKYLDFEGNFTGKLTIQLVQPEKNNPSFEGCNAAQSIDFQYPKEVTFEWKNGKLADIVSDNGKFIGYDNELMFGDFNTSVEYQSGLNHIFIPSKVKPTKWRADFSTSRIFNVKGKADIKKAFWALPIVKVGNPVTLGEPENSGGWGLRLSTKLYAKWIGTDEQQPDAILDETLLLLYPYSLLLHNENTAVDTTSVNEIRQDFSCWEISAENPALIPVSFSYRNNFLLVYYCHATEGETLLAGCMGQMQPDRPVFAEGTRIAMKDLKGWVIFQAKAGEVTINALLSNHEAWRTPFKLLALQNALMVVSQPTGLALRGTLSGTNHNSIENGKVTLLHGLLRWKPILPDPYVSNLREGWDLDIHMDRVSAISPILFAQTSWEEPNKPILNFNADLSLSSVNGIESPSDPTIKPLPVQLDGQTIGMIKEHEINGKQRENKNKIDRVFDQLEERLSGWKLLDVSTNMDLIGVSVSPSLFGTRRASLLTDATNSKQLTNNAFVVKEMAVNTPLSLVHVFTVPQVQWEPVRTLPEDQNIATLGWFPEYLGSATDGGPTRLIGINQELSPIIPDVVIRQIRESFTEGSPAAALTTLSFGLKAIVQLSPQNTTRRNADTLDIIQPAFSQKKMKGGIQINLMAESGNPKSDDHSPGFEGFIPGFEAFRAQMAQTLNGYELFTGTELGLSVLADTSQPPASVETQFNKEFAAEGSNPFVPVTRFDLSGYGASNFSEWDNPSAMASIGKVQFKVIVGRTAFEVVKFVSKIYPWGPTVTRTVTIERRSGGGVIRKDTGWQATQAGIFDFRVKGIPNNPYEFRPGIFRGCFDLKNIRPASNVPLTFVDPANGNNIELAPVYFDTNVQLDGQPDGNIVSKGVLGFIQLSPKPNVSVDPWLPRLLSKEALQKLITDQGAIGGPIDTILNVGNSGFMFRATRFELDVTDNGGTPNFIGVVRGQPVLPNNGSWSVVKMAAPGNTADPQEATSADLSRGTPLFIENIWNPPLGNQMNVSGPTGPYRFADPVDLFAAQPRYDYGFMQNTGSQAFLFRRPVIVSGTNEISSSLKPAFADPFALFTTKGVFPPIANSIEFPSPPIYKLLIQAGTGKLRLNTPVNLSKPRTQLLMAQDGTNQIVIDYDQSELRYNLNYDNWNAELDTFCVWTSIEGISKLFGTRFSLRAGTSQQAKLVNVVSLMKQEIRDGLSFIPGMGEDQPVADIELGMTNGPEKKIAASYSCSIEIDLSTGEIEFTCGNPKKPEKREPYKAKKSISLKISGAFEAGGFTPVSYAPATAPGAEAIALAVDLASGFPNATLDTKLEGELQAKLPLGGVYFLVIGFDAEIAWHKIFRGLVRSELGPKSSSSLEIGAYVGVGAGRDIGPFVAEGFVAGGVIYKKESSEEGKLLWLVKVEAEIDLKVVSVGLAAELQGYIKDGKICVASGEIAVNVSIFLVINIEETYEYEVKEKL